MGSIAPVTRSKLKGWLESFVWLQVDEHQDPLLTGHDLPNSDVRELLADTHRRPFYTSLLPPQVRRLCQFGQGLSQNIDSTFAPCAAILAQAYHGEAQYAYDFTTPVSRSAINEIDHQVVTFEHAAEKGVPRPRLDAMIDAVLSARRPGDQEPRSTRADLYVRTRDGRRLFFELKSPRPNKGQCVEVTQRILRMHLLCGAARPAVQAYFALPYNPYGPSRADYTWSFARNYTPFDEAVLIGAEFWDMIGGPGAYEALLDLYREVGHDKSKYIIDALAFGF